MQNNPSKNEKQEEKSFIAGTEHAEEAQSLFDHLRPHIKEFSDKQLLYAVVAMTDPRIGIEEKCMLITIADLAGPDLTTPVDEDCLFSSMQDGLRSAILSFLPAEGSA